MYKEAWAEMMAAKHILLVSHVEPDGDTIGSVLALYDVLKRNNKRVSLYNPSKEMPRSFSFLANFDKIKDRIPKFFDLVISCDCSSFDRLKIEEGDYKLINIDHHLLNTMYGDINIIDSDCASAGMVIYELLRQNSIKISVDCAKSLYVSIVEDTGFFSYSSLDKRTFDTVAKLVGFGVDAREIAELLRGRVSLAKMRLLGYVFREFELYFDAKVATIFLDSDILDKTGAKLFDTKDIADRLRDIATVQVAMMIVESRDKTLKVSLRSIRDIDISDIAKEFGGGGHKNSAGFEATYCNYIELKDAMLSALKTLVHS